jgi:hypothetical protein
MYMKSTSPAESEMCSFGRAGVLSLDANRLGGSRALTTIGRENVLVSCFSAKSDPIAPNQSESNQFGGRFITDSQSQIAKIRVNRIKSNLIKPILRGGRPQGPREDVRPTAQVKCVPMLRLVSHNLTCTRMISHKNYVFLFDVKEPSSPKGSLFTISGLDLHEPRNTHRAKGLRVRLGLGRKVRGIYLASSFFSGFTRQNPMKPLEYRQHILHFESLN